MTETTDPVARVAAAVTDLADALPGLLEACTDPQGLDVAELLADLVDARLALVEVERDVEAACAKALMDDMVHTDRLRVERRRGTDRKAWSHDDWQADVRAKALQAHGLKGAVIVTPDGEEAPAGVLHELLRTVQDAAGSHPPKTGALRGLGLDARDYCESFPGRVTVKVTRMDAEPAGGAA